MELSENQVDEIKEAIEYIRGTFPADGLFENLVTGAVVTYAHHTIDGDDLKSACYYLNNLMQIFGSNNAEL
jgi:hypothetical protein